MGAIACFTFDNMGEAADIGSGVLDAPLRSTHPSIAVGYPNLLRLLDRQRIRATFFIEGWNGQHHPEAVAEVVSRGHELGMHGWVHEAWAGLGAVQEAELAKRATDSLEKAAGVRPVGFRAPGGARNPNTEAILAELGYVYDASLGDAMQTQRLANGLAQVPFVWSGVDGFYYLRDKPVEPHLVQQRWLQALEAVASNGGLFLSICHAFITGMEDARLAALEAVMSAARQDSRVRICNAREVAEAIPRTASPESVLEEERRHV